MGNQVTTRGKKKYLGGVGTKITGHHAPPVQAEPAAGEGFRRGRRPHAACLVCVQCIRSGAVVKRVRNAPFSAADREEGGLPRLSAAHALPASAPASPKDWLPMAHSRRSDVERVALLARLELDAAEEIDRRCTPELAAIVEYVDSALARWTPTGVEPMVHAPLAGGAEQTNVLRREDTVLPRA